MEKVACIIVSFAKTDFQRDLLKRSVESVMKYHPTANIIVLNDNHETTLDDLLPRSPLIRCEKTRHPKCGEVNAYVWSIEHMNEFTRFFFIHDSVSLHKALPLQFQQGVHFRPLWYATPYFASVGLMLPEIEDVIKDIQIGPTSGRSIYQIILKRYIFVTFGCMGMWDTAFCHFLKEKTNFLEHAGRFNTRNLRMLFERLTYIFYAYCHPDIPFRHFAGLAICGDITAHEAAFSNTKLEPSAARNPYALKVWQGR